MQKGKCFKAVFWIVAGLVLLMGIIQILSFLPGQLEAMKQAAAQGVAAQQISKFFWQQVIPQVLSYVMSTVAYVGILFSIGMLYEKVNDAGISRGNLHKQLPYAIQPQENDVDTLFDDFEIVEDENK